MKTDNPNNWMPATLTLQAYDGGYSMELWADPDEDGRPGRVAVRNVDAARLPEQIDQSRAEDGSLNDPDDVADAVASLALADQNAEDEGVA
jgi:hypothetical protein